MKVQKGCTALLCGQTMLVAMVMVYEQPSALSKMLLRLLGT